jgi:hypothetical protein
VVCEFVGLAGRRYAQTSGTCAHAVDSASGQSCATVVNTPVMAAAAVNGAAVGGEAFSSAFARYLEAEAESGTAVSLSLSTMTAATSGIEDADVRRYGLVGGRGLLIRS